jgi:hypothetical protein
MSHAQRRLPFEQGWMRTGLLVLAALLIWLVLTEAVAGRSHADPARAGGTQSDGMPPLAREALDPAVGRWLWGTGSIVSFGADGTGNDDRGNKLAWRRFDMARRLYVIRWSYGMTDTAILASDGASMDVASHQGLRFVVHRISDEPPSAAGSSGWTDLTGSWNGGLLHIWQSGRSVLVTAAWTRADGSHVAWRGEGQLSGRSVALSTRYAPSRGGTAPPWRATLTVSEDGRTITAVFTAADGSRQTRVFSRDR